MTHNTCEMMWLKNLLLEFDFRHLGPMPIYRTESGFHERTKHIKVDCHLVRDARTKKVIYFPFTPSSKQLADLLTKAASLKVLYVLCSKLCMVDIYTPA